MFRPATTTGRRLATAAAVAVRATASGTAARTLSFHRSLLSAHPSSNPSRLDVRYFSASGKTAKNCPQCGSPLPTPLPACPSCYHVAALPQTTTYHDILGLPPDSNKFDVDPAVLKDHFRQLQRVIHPDKWSIRGPEIQDLAAGMSSIVNKAYGTLLNPFARAEYILQLNGMTIEETDNIDDSELIMEIMDAREGLDSAESQDEVEQIRGENADKILKILPRISSSVAARDWAAVKSDAVKLKYLQGIEAAAEAWPNRVHDH